MAAVSLQDITEFSQVIRLLEEHLEWRVELRRVLLTDELLNLPQQVERLTVQMGELVEAQRRTETQLVVLNDSVRRMGDDVGMLKRHDLERMYREKIDVFFDPEIHQAETKRDVCGK